MPPQWTARRPPLPHDGGNPYRAPAARRLKRARKKRTGVKLKPCRAYHGRRFCSVAKMGDSGLSGMINAGAALEHEFDNMVVVSLGRPAVGDEDYEMQIYGAQLAFRITLRPAGLTLAAALMDSAEAAWDLLLRTMDTAAGWATVRRLAASLERNGVRSLQRPIEVGDPDCWVIN